MRYVLDCSVAIRWFVPQTHYEKAVALLPRLQRGEVAFTAPDIVIAEFGHVLRKLVVGGKLEADASHPILAHFLALPVSLVPVKGLATRALRLAYENSATFYDALYVALAECEDLKVLTADESMTRAFARLHRTLFLPEVE